MLGVRLLSRDPYVFAHQTPVSCVSQPWPDDLNHGISSGQTPLTLDTQLAMSAPATSYRETNLFWSLLLISCARLRYP